VKDKIILLAASLLALAAGCRSPSPVSPFKQEIDTLENEKAVLARQVELEKAQNERLKDQVKVLAGMKPDVKFSDLYLLEQVSIGGRTSLYDKDENGKPEKLLVYLQPIDDQGDILKAVGSVDVELWDLGKNPEQARLYQWHVDPEQLKKLWFSTVLTANYRLCFDVGETVGSIKDPLTVKVVFTDYLTGKVFNEEVTIKP
jgi:hypothetical protein